MASGDEFPGIDRRELALVIKARMRAIAAIRMAPALADIDSALIARGKAMASVLAGIDSVLIARGKAMASALVVIDSVLIARANAMAPALAAMSARTIAMAPALAAMSARAHAMAPALAAMKLVLNVQALAEPVARAVPELRMIVTQEQHHDSEAKDTEIRRLRRRVRFLESRLRGGGTIEYDWEDNSLPWSTEEN